MSLILCNTLIKTKINVEGVQKFLNLINKEVGINVKKLVHNCNKRGLEGGKKSKKSINVEGGFFSKSISVTPRLLER